MAEARRKLDRMSQITELLDASRGGDDAAVDRLFHLLYDDLRRLARSRLRRSGPITLLDTTALVHESYLRLFQAREIEACNRGHFMAFAAHVMRSIVVDFVRRRSSERHGGNAVHVALEDDVAPADPREREVLQVHEALEELEGIDKRVAQVVELRYFAGMTEQEVADVLEIGVRSVSRDWEKARLFLAANVR